MPADEITNAELARRLDDFRRDIREDLAEIKLRQDQYVLREVYHADQRALLAKVDGLDRRQDATEEQARTARRWLVSAIVMPAIVLVVQVILALRGPK